MGDLKICDFGLARGLEEEEETKELTEYVVTRWYRAPEVMLAAAKYSKAIDIWSAGCILCELVGRKPIFPGRDFKDQIRRIVATIGMPSDDSLGEWLPSPSPARLFLHKCSAESARPWEKIYPQANVRCLEVVEATLTFSPLRRVTAKDALEMLYYDSLHVSEEEPVAFEPVDFSFDAFTPTKRLLQNFIYRECAELHPDIIKRDRELLAARGIDKILQ